jgi:WhiB family redox-sensing transcriptional regulator
MTVGQMRGTTGTLYLMPADPQLPTNSGRPWARQAWMVAAACPGKTELFFAPPNEREPARLVREAAARLVCAACPVLAPCRRYAVEFGELGFWGGQNDDERAATRRQFRRVAS